MVLSDLRSLPPRLESKAGYTDLICCMIIGVVEFDVVVISDLGVFGYAKSFRLRMVTVLLSPGSVSRVDDSSQNRSCQIRSV